MQKTASLAVVLFALLMLCGCGGNSIRQQLYSDGTMQTAPSATPSGSIQQEMIVEAGISKNLDIAFKAFVNDPLVRLSLDDAKKLFDEMIDNTKEYLTMYKI